MEEYKKCNISLNVKKAHIFNSREEKILAQHEAWSKHFSEKGRMKIVYYCKNNLYNIVIIILFYAKSKNEEYEESSYFPNYCN